MTLKELFLREVRKGDHIVVSVSNLQDSITGTVIELDDEVCRIMTEGGSPRISLDYVASYDIFESECVSESIVDSATDYEKSTKQQPAKAGIAFSHFQNQALKTLSECLKVAPPDDEYIVDWDGINEALKTKNLPRDAYREINNIRSTFKYIRDQLDKMHEKDLDERMHNLRAKILVLCKKYPHVSQELYCMIAAMYFITKKYSDAAAYFEKGNDFYGAVYSAYREEDCISLNRLLNRYITDPTLHDPFLYKVYADNCVKTLDASALCIRAHKIQKSTELTENDRKSLKCLCACGFRIAQILGLPIGWAMEYISGNELKCIESFINSLPGTWTKMSISISDETAVPSQGSIAPMTSTIRFFDHIHRYGKINGHSNDHFFFIEQVNCTDSLRHILARPGMAQGLEVSFLLGKPRNPEKPPQAYDIRLTDRGRKEAANRLEGSQPPKKLVEEKTGSLEEYTFDFGKIYVEGEAYNVIESQIIDPYLKGYLAISTYPDILVKFMPDTDRNGKRIAKSVQIADSSVVFSDSDVKEMLRSKAVTQVELDNWVNRGSNVKEQTRQPVFEDFYRVPYVALEPVEISTPDPAPVQPVPKANNFFSTSIPVEKKTHSASTLPDFEPLPLPDVNRFANLPLIALDQNYYEEAHRYLMAGNLEKAEELYTQALCARDRTESTVSDLASQVFLRGDTSRLTDAYQVVDAFKEFIPREKEIILKISICQKSKERPYQILLCHLINDHVAISEKANTKLHFLSVQGKTLRDLGEYQMALTSYSRWQQVYENEVQYRGQSAVSQYANALNYVKTGEAVCYYFLGDRIRAKSMAKEVLRISSDNTTAQSILNDTLDAKDADDFLAPMSEDEYRLDNIKISNFAKAQLTSAPVSLYVKKNVENGKYTGSARDAFVIIRTLQDMPGKTPAMRRDILRIAANIISQQQAQATAKEHRLLQNLHLTESDQKKYIARSMAAFGDAILEVCGDTDSARYGFLQAIEMLDSSEEDYIRSVKHYIDSFYNAQQEMAQIVRNDLSVRSVKYSFTELSKQKPIDSEEFILGIIELCRILKKNHISAYNEIIRVLKDSSAKDEWERWFDNISLDCEFGSLEQKLERVGEKCIQYRNNLSDFIEQLPSQFFSQQRSKELAGELSIAGQSSLLSVNDKNRMRTLQSIIQNFSGYFTTLQFQYRSNLLQTTENDVLKLIQDISSQPTQFSYDVLLPNLQKIHTNLQQATETHYRKLPPEISIATTDVGAYVGMNNEVNLHLTISNGVATSRGNERQMADNISIRITRISEGAEYLRMDTDFSGGIFGGEEAEVILVFRITDPRILMYGIDLSICCSYRYNESRMITRDAHVDYSDTIVIRQGSRAQIKNPFSAHIGKEMSDPAMFVGREQIIKKVTEAMVMDSGYNYGAGFLFYGQTRAGKSSVRVHLGNRIRNDCPGVILVDLGNLNPNSFEEKAFYCELIFRINDEIKENHAELSNKLCERGINAPPDSIYEASLPEVTAKFKRYLSRISSLIKNQTMIVVLVDEFSAINTAIQEGRASSNFMQSWKAMLENYGLFTVCFGQDDSPAFILQNQNAFARMDVEKITYLEKPYAIELMEKPMRISISNGTEKSRFTAAVTEELYRLTSGSAYLIIKLCSLLVDYLNEKGAEYVTPGILQRFVKFRAFSGQHCIGEGDFEPQLGDRSDPSLYPLNLIILLRIARAAQSSGYADIAFISDADLMPREGQTSRRRKDELFRRLHERDVIEIAEGRRCRIKVALLNRWLLMKYGAEE